MRSSSSPALHVLVIAGGAGTRLWPLSTDDRPKQFHALVSDRSLIQETVDRFTGLPGLRGVSFSSNRRYREQLRSTFPDVADRQLILEPEKRNTAPAVAFSVAVLAAEMALETVLVVTPADQWVGKPATFRTDIARASVRAARLGEIVTVGIAPDRPETGYGYLRPAGRTGKEGQLEAFVEKPDAVRARRLIREGCLWNAGIFVATLATYREAFAACAPALLAAAERAAGARARGDDAAVTRHYAAMDSISFDYAIAERFGRIGFVRSACGWSDVGGWQAVWTARRKDRAKNAIVGKVEAENCDECLLIADGVELRVRDRRQAAIVATPWGTYDGPLAAAVKSR